MWSLSDESLLAGLASSDADSATAFVRRFQGRVFGLAKTIVGDTATAEEVAQEAFIRVWVHAGAFDPRRGRVVTWVLAITRNVAIDILRMRRQEPVDPQVMAAMLATRPEAVEEKAVQVEDVDSLRRALSELPEEQARALVLASFCGLTGREISDSEGIPLGTVKTRIRTALMKLRETLEVRDD